ncbi:MAG: TSUP family transporter [Solobacterium sp.]|nr:TSUP family transporter [Solobacterium sp.]
MLTEYLWIILAAAGAGIGTGLAGLSAATVMVPILIVLCPSFAGETGAYQATAIALASDILGSAVTAMTYIRYKNIDLKRGWIMMACILSMCIAGSYAAWLAGNVVLGGFTLFLTFCIGIRFLVKPDSSKDRVVEKGTALDWKGVLISLFFGLTIGFGTGFVGTGGGMMMLVVFTVFLGMDRKRAVGTSTLIMTFTALIAAAAHIWIHPAIIQEKAGILVLCAAVATLCSLASAHFANRVSDRIVGYVTGAVLTVMGAVLIFLHYREGILSVPYVPDILRCLKAFVLYILPCIAVLLVIRRLNIVPRHVFRKLLHLVAFTCVIRLITAATSWQAAVITLILIAVVLYPVLVFAERFALYSELFTEKKPGEIKKSLLLLFFTIAAVAAGAWGMLGRQDFCIMVILMWGIGDAMAALVGIPYGRHRITWSLTDGKKSVEGSLAMFVFSFSAGCITQICFGLPLTAGMILRTAAMACAGTVTELVSKEGSDTVFVPLALLISGILLTL